jgi:hypothetical protein
MRWYVAAIARWWREIRSPLRGLSCPERPCAYVPVGPYILEVEV